MKISSLMKKLEKIKNQKGDIEVCVLENDFEFGKLKKSKQDTLTKSISAFMVIEKTVRTNTQTKMKSNAFVCHYKI